MTTRKANSQYTLQYTIKLLDVYLFHMRQPIVVCSSGPELLLERLSLSTVRVGESGLLACSSHGLLACR